MQIMTVGENTFLIGPGSKSGRFENVPYGVSDLSENCFKNGVMLEGVQLPPSLRRIGDRAFNGCRALNSIELPNGLEVIGQEAFCDSGIRSIKIPLSVGHIGARAFMGCKLESVDVDSIEQLCRVGTDAWESYNSPYVRHTLMVKGELIDRITMPIIKGWRQRFNGESKVFAGVTNIKEVIYPEGTEYATFSFAGCENLESVVFPEEVEGVSFITFRDCPKIRRVRFPKNIRSWCSVGGGTIGKNDLLRRFPSAVEEDRGVHYIGKWCVGVTAEESFIREGTIGIAAHAPIGQNVKALIIPSTVRWMLYQAFMFPASLRYVEFVGSTPDIEEEALGSPDEAIGSISVVVRDRKICQMKTGLNGHPYRHLLRRNGALYDITSYVPDYDDFGGVQGL